MESYLPLLSREDDSVLLLYSKYFSNKINMILLEYSSDVGENLATTIIPIHYDFGDKDGYTIDAEKLSTKGSYYLHIINYNDYVKMHISVFSSNNVESEFNSNSEESYTDLAQLDYLIINNEDNYKYFHTNLIAGNNVFALGSFAGIEIEDFNKHECHKLTTSGWVKLDELNQGRNLGTACLDLSKTFIYIIGGNNTWDLISDEQELIERYYIKQDKWERVSILKNNAKYKGSSYSKSVFISKDSILLISGVQCGKKRSYGDCFLIKIINDGLSCSIEKLQSIPDYKPCDLNRDYYSVFISNPVFSAKLEEVYYLSYSQRVHIFDTAKLKWKINKNKLI